MKKEIFNDLYPKYSFSEIKERLKEKRISKINLTEKEYELILLAQISNDWRNVHKNNIYKNHSSEYCTVLEVVKHSDINIRFIKLLNNTILVINDDRQTEDNIIAEITKTGKVKYTNSHIYLEEKFTIKNYIKTNFPKKVRKEG